VRDRDEAFGDTVAMAVMAPRGVWSRTGCVQVKPQRWGCCGSAPCARPVHRHASQHPYTENANLRRSRHKPQCHRIHAI